MVACSLDWPLSVEAQATTSSLRLLGKEESHAMKTENHAMKRPNLDHKDFSPFHTGQDNYELTEAPNKYELKVVITGHFFIRC